MNWQLEIVTFALLGFFAYNILRGKNWARLGLCVVLALDLLGSVILDWSSSWHSLHLDVLGDLLAIAALYGPGCQFFFFGHAKTTPLGYQLGTAICYVVTTIFLTTTIALPAVYARLDGPEDYRLMLFSAVPFITLGLGRLFGVILNPRRDIGWMLAIAAILSVGFQISNILRQAGSFEAAFRGDVPYLNMNPWMMVIVATLVGMAGWVLIRQSSAEPVSGT